MKADDKKKGEQIIAENLKLELRKKLVNLFHHPGTPTEDKDKIIKIVDKLVKT